MIKMKVNSFVNSLIYLIFLISLLAYETHFHSTCYGYFQAVIIILTSIVFILLLKNENVKNQFGKELAKSEMLILYSIMTILSTLITLLLYSNNRFYTIFIVIMYAFSSFFYFLLLPIYLSYNNEIEKKLFKLIIFFVEIVSVFGILLYFKNGLLGYYLEGKRSGSIYFDPNFFSVVSAIALMLSMSIDFNKVTKIIIFIISILSIIVSGSRGTMLSLLICLLYFIFMNNKKNILKKIFIFIFSAIFFIGVIYFLSKFGFWRMHQGTNGRVEMLIYAFNKIKESPLVGFGFDSVTFLLKKDGFVNTNTHNSLVDNLLRYGVPCTIVYIFIIVKSAWNGFFVQRKQWLNLLMIFLLVNMNTILYSFGGVGFVSMLLTFTLGRASYGGNYVKNKN